MTQNQTKARAWHKLSDRELTALDFEDWPRDEIMELILYCQERGAICGLHAWAAAKFVANWCAERDSRLEAAR